MASLTIQNLRKAYGQYEVLKNICLEVEDGEFIVLVGPSGCGKSTLLSIVAGLDAETDGRLEIGGRSVKGVEPKDRNIAMVFQSYALYPTMSVRDNITFGMACRNIPKDVQARELDRVARLLQIDTLLNRKPGQLSGGQRQRVAIGRALVRNPTLFLFDEPLSNLDAKLRVEMRWEIKQLYERLKSTFIYVTHDQIEAMTMATRIAVMFNGEVQQFATPDEIYNNPANLFVARFMGTPPMNTFLCDIVHDDGGMAAQLAEGMRIPIGGRLKASASKVMMGIRPEAIAETNRRFGPRGELGHRASATVKMAEPTGAETMLQLDLGGQSCIGRFAPDERFVAGNRIDVSIDMRNICFFDPDTERRIY